MNNTNTTNNPVPKTIDSTLEKVTADYLMTIDKNNPPSPNEIAATILQNTDHEFSTENAVRQANHYPKWPIPRSLAPSQIADILLYLYPIVRIALAGEDGDTDYDVLGLYQSSGDDLGLYSIDQEDFDRLIRKFKYTISSKEIQEVMSNLLTNADRKIRCADKDLVAVNNGIFDFSKKVLLPFTPDCIFTAKSRVDYNPNATNIIIHNDADGTDWDVESWMKDLFDDPELEQLAWELISAILRPNVPWYKSAWFISETGNNGKGTICSLMRSLTGRGTYTVIPLAKFSKDFMLEPLIKANAVIVDENSVGTYIDSADNLKAAITGDVIQVNRKFKTPVNFKFRGMLIECVNEVPRVKDRSPSLIRRLLLIPFRKCFTGMERKYIKEDYLKRKEVLEYVLYKVMHMDHYELSNPTECIHTMEEFRLNNDPVAQFAEEILPECKWDFLPNQFLYDIYLAWLRENCPSSTPLNKTQFLRDLRRFLDTSKTWYAPKSPRNVGHMMDKSEPLIAKYNLVNWFNPNYLGSDIEKRCHPEVPDSSRGIQRR